MNRTLRVDHVKNYKQPRTKGDDGEWIEPEEQSLNAKPEMIIDEAASDSGSSSSGAGSIDPEDPMRDYLISKRREEKKSSKTSSKKSKKKKDADETPEERRARKARKKEKKERRTKKSEGVKGVERLLESLGQDVVKSAPGAWERRRSRTPTRSRRRSPSPPAYRERSPHARGRNRSLTPDRRPRHPRSSSPGRDDYHARSGRSMRHDDDGGGDRDGKRSPRTREYGR